MDDGNKLYSIGHGRRKAADFIDLLKRYQIRYLIDVRSIPFSRFNPQYNQKALNLNLSQNGITYVFMGDTLGGRPSDTDCYDSSGKIDYKKVSTKEFFKTGIDRLKTAYEKDRSAAIMCSESKPQECHRSKLIGVELYKDGINILHIDELGNLKRQNEIRLS